MKDPKNSRRKFLRNVSLGTAAMATVPLIGKTALASSSRERTTGVDCDPLTLDYYGQGPFYTENAPEILDTQLADSEEPGTRLIISGLVRNLDCTQVIPNTIIDMWHADDSGEYDNQGFNLRGITYSNAEGYYIFETILPGKYLNGASFRPRHIHFKITAPGFPEITTQLYFEGDTDIPDDPAASITSGQFDATHRIIPIELNSDGKYEGVWDIVVDGIGIDSVDNIHADKGMIYNVSPNPFTNQVNIHYGVFQPSKVKLSVFDLRGVLVAELEEQNLGPEKYQVTWNVDSSLASGIYWISLKINDLQVHYRKIVKA